VTAALLLDCLQGPGLTSTRAAVGPGEWLRLAAAQPDGLIEAIAGIAPATGGVVLDGTELAGLAADARQRAGLATATCRLPDLQGLRVGDVLLLGRSPARPTARPPRWWQEALGTSRARAAQADAEAAVRNLAGRLGLAGWVDRDAVDLPPQVAARADTLRALGSRPRAVVWRRPEWLDPSVADDLAAVIDGERRRGGVAVLEVVSGVGRP
jgi:ABC-type branched-subunit amino acid transport system ATPase component